MEKRKAARSAMNDFKCGIKLSPKKSCQGTAFVPISLWKLAKIRVKGFQTFTDVKFSCGHVHTITLTN